MQKWKEDNFLFSKIPGQSVFVLIFIAVVFFSILIKQGASKNVNSSLIAAVSSASAETITIASPNGGETWMSNSTHSIAWIFEGTGNVKIDLMRGSKIARTITRSIPGDARIYSWAIPSGQPPSEDYFIRISSTSNPLVSDSSDAPFRIVLGGTGSPDDMDDVVDYIISTPGMVIKDQTISVSGSVIVVADDVTLQNVVIKCAGESPDQDGIRAIGVNRLKVRLAVINGCNRHGIYLKDGSGHDIAEGMITGIGEDAVVFDNIRDSWLMGWLLRGGVAIKNGSYNNRIVANIVAGNGQGFNHSPSPYSISADSYGNQIVRNRTRDNNKLNAVVISENPNNLWFQNVCDEVTGYANCFFRNDRELDGDYGDRTQFSPRIWSICNEATTGHRFSCDFETYGDAAVDSRVGDGDVLVMDSKTGPKNIAAAITISRPLWLIGNVMAQKGNYACEINVGDGTGSAGIMVTSPGVRIENLQIDPPPLIQTDAEFVNIKVKNEKGRWVLTDTDKSLMPKLKPPGC